MGPYPASHCRQWVQELGLGAGAERKGVRFDFVGQGRKMGAAVFYASRVRRDERTNPKS